MNSSVVFVGDTHFGHRAIVKHAGDRRGGDSVLEHDEWVMDQLLKVEPTKRTLWYFLGDVSMEVERLTLFNELPGRKILVAGNHDLLDTGAYLKYFERVMGGFRKYDMWITHMPMHPLELYGYPNIHGHTHYNTLWMDDRYLNAAIEWLPGKRPLTLDEVREHFNKKGVAHGR
jgi:calcineurin-like phosphoesterase family protein